MSGNNIRWSEDWKIELSQFMQKTVTGWADHLCNFLRKMFIGAAPLWHRGAQISYSPNPARCVTLKIHSLTKRLGCLKSAVSIEKKQLWNCQLEVKAVWLKSAIIISSYPANNRIYQSTLSSTHVLQTIGNESIYPSLINRCSADLFCLARNYNAQNILPFCTCHYSICLTEFCALLGN